MNNYKINYTVKDTKSNNTYISINQKDKNTFILCVLSIMGYMQELSVSDDKDITDIIKWYRKSDKRYPYNKRLQKRNSPESMLAGVINNMMFGQQDDLSLEQLPHYEHIINLCVQLIYEVIRIKKITLQNDHALTKIVFGIEI